MHPLALLLIYSLVCMAASWAGGWVPLVVQLTHRRMQIAVSFVSGIVLGIGLLHLVPHAFEALGSIDRTVLWVLAGFLVTFFLERFFHFHHHEVPEQHLVLVDEPLDEPAPAQHDHAHGHAHVHHHTSGSSSFSLVSVAVGLSLHGLIDGVAVAAAVMAESVHAAMLAGVGTCLAVALHKPFDGLTIGTLMAHSGRSASSRHLLNAAYAVVTPLGMLLFYFLSTSTAVLEHSLGEVLGFAAGAFLCIATGDLLPELQFHRHDRLALSTALLLGIGVAWSTVFLESGGHDHFHPAAPGIEATEHEHDHAGEDHEHDSEDADKHGHAHEHDELAH